MKWVKERTKSIQIIPSSTHPLSTHPFSPLHTPPLLHKALYPPFLPPTLTHFHAASMLPLSPPPVSRTPTILIALTHRPYTTLSNAGTSSFRSHYRRQPLPSLSSPPMFRLWEIFSLFPAQQPADAADCCYIPYIQCDVLHGGAGGGGASWTRRADTRPLMYGRGV
jgi:hypothetical protein